MFFLTIFFYCVSFLQKFKVDIAELYDFYSSFSASEVLSVAPDLTPHYAHVLRFHRATRPDSPAGRPGARTQGFNTGVVLFDLDRMRGSELYRNVTSPDAVDSLAEKYQFRSHLGDQCMFSLLGENGYLFPFLRN